MQFTQDDPLFDDKVGSCEIDLEGMDLNEDAQEVVRVVDNNWFSEVRPCFIHNFLKLLTAKVQDAKIHLKLSYQP